MNTAVRILCLRPKFYHITDLLMNLQWLPVHQLILLEVLVLTYNLSDIFNKLLKNPDNS